MNAPTEITKQTLPATPGHSSLLEVITRLATDSTIDLARLEKVMDLRERIAAEDARRAYVEAFAMMQNELPIIAERGEIKIGGNNAKGQGYALWEDVNEAIKPVLSQHGFGLDFKSDQDDKSISITGILRHTGGHTEKTTLRLPIDTSGSKNAVQAIGSSMSYGKRYTAAALLNLTSRGGDDDGRAAGAGETVSAEQIEKIKARIVEVGADIAGFCKVMKVGRVEDVRAKDFGQAMKGLQEVEDWAKSQAKKGAK